MSSRVVPPLDGQGLIFAQAKINLYLKVLGRRADGYHELDSVMARLELADRIRLTIVDEPASDCLEVVSTLTASLPADFWGPNNLALKAVRLYREQTGWPQAGVNIWLEKNIPLGAGLGGGSANGAAVLSILNQAAPQPLAQSDLAALGLALGADVPFGLMGVALARLGGVGERLLPLPESWAKWAGRPLLLVNPGLNLSTATVFKNLGLTNRLTNNNLGPLSEPLPGENDLLNSALGLAPVLGQVIEAVKSLRPLFWGLSGSGPTFWLYEPKLDWAGLKDDHPDWWVKEVVVLA